MAGKGEKMDKKKRKSLFLFCFICVLASVSLILQQTIFTKSGRYALVEVGGKEVARLSLNKDAEIQVGTVEEGYNIIKVQDGSVAVTETDCPDKICVNTGKLRTTGGVIVCLPHKLVVTVVGNGEENKVDGVVR